MLTSMRRQLCFFEHRYREYEPVDVDEARKHSTNAQEKKEHSKQPTGLHMHSSKRRSNGATHTKLPTHTFNLDLDGQLAKRGIAMVDLTTQRRSRYGVVKCIVGWRCEV
jgi:hypothetical protein